MSLLGINQPAPPQVSAGPQYPSLLGNPYSPHYSPGAFTQQAQSMAGNGYTHGPFAAVTPPPAVPVPTTSGPSTLSQLLPLLGVAALGGANNGLFGSAIQGGTKALGNYLTGLLNPGSDVSAGINSDYGVNALGNAMNDEGIGNVASLFGPSAAGGVAAAAAPAAVPAGVMSIEAPAGVAAEGSIATGAPEMTATALGSTDASGVAGFSTGAADAGAGGGSSALGGLAAAWPAAVAAGGLLGLNAIFNHNSAYTPYDVGKSLQRGAAGLGTLSNQYAAGAPTYGSGPNSQQIAQGLAAEQGDWNQMANMAFTDPQALLKILGPTQPGAATRLQGLITPGRYA